MTSEISPEGSSDNFSVLFSWIFLFILCESLSYISNVWLRIWCESLYFGYWGSDSSVREAFRCMRISQP